MGISMSMRKQLNVVCHLKVKKSRYRVLERISFGNDYYGSNNSPIAAQNKFVTKYKLEKIGPSVLTIEKLLLKFYRIDSVCEDSIDSVAMSVDEQTSERRRVSRQPKKMYQTSCTTGGNQPGDPATNCFLRPASLSIKIQTNQPLSANGTAVVFYQKYCRKN